MSNFKLEFRLKQFTPLLHFQGSEDGACLRASEVKPMLDRFITEQVGTIPENWLIGAGDDTAEKAALRYKLRFEGSGDVMDQIHPLYFGNMGENAGNIKGMWYASGIKGTVVCMIPELLEKIRKYIVPFFALHCFGTRSNKGFGSFEVIELDHEANAALSPEELAEFKPEKITHIYKLQSSRPEYNDSQGEMCLDDIFVLSCMMKGGFNRPYYKGEIQTSIANTGSEKAFIKSRIFPAEKLKAWYDSICQPGNRGKSSKYKNYRYVRAMLGISDGFTYGVGRNGKKIVVKAVDENIKRFADPVRYKPCENGFYILVEEIPEIMFHQEFKYRYKYSRTEYSIWTPPKSEIDLPAFVASFLQPIITGNRSNWKNLTGQDYQYYPSRRIIHFNDTLQRLSVVFSGGDTP